MTDNKHFLLQIDRDKLMKEKQTREDVVKQKEELERRMMEYQEEASRAKEALVIQFSIQLSWIGYQETETILTPFRTTLTFRRAIAKRVFGRSLQ